MSIPSNINRLLGFSDIGQVLSERNMQEIAKFAYVERLLILADEVYQDNVYVEGKKFHSFKKVISEMPFPYNKTQLASFMSCSKGNGHSCLALKVTAR